MLAHHREERLVEATRRVGGESDVHGHAVRAQMLEALPMHERIRIFHRRNHARDAGVDDALDARTRASHVAARLERAVQGGAAGAIAGFVERNRLCVRLADTPVISLPHDDAVTRHDHRADERIGTRAAAAALGQLQRAIHVVAVYHFSSKRPLTYSSAENGTRSSMPSPTPT